MSILDFGEIIFENLTMSEFGIRTDSISFKPIIGASYTLAEIDCNDASASKRVSWVQPVRAVTHATTKNGSKERYFII
jgi:hypothetical protein